MRKQETISTMSLRIRIYPAKITGYAEENKDKLSIAAKYELTKKTDNPAGNQKSNYDFDVMQKNVVVIWVAYKSYRKN